MARDHVVVTELILGDDGRTGLAALGVQPGLRYSSNPAVDDVRMPKDYNRVIQFLMVEDQVSQVVDEGVLPVEDRPVTDALQAGKAMPPSFRSACESLIEVVRSPQR